MFTDALWSTMLSVVLLLAMTVFFKGVFFRSIYEAGGLTAPQVAVDWRLWSLDWWFWLILGSLVAVALFLNLASACVERSCERKRYEQVRAQRQRLEKMRNLDLAEP